MTEPVGTIDQQVKQVTDLFLRESARSLSAMSAAAPPAMYLFADGRFDGWVGCRPYTSGRDMQLAIAAMAWPAAGRDADRIVLGWEDWTLRTAVSGPGEYTRALMVADVPLLGSHTVSWWPYTLTPARRSSLHTAVLQWIPESTGSQSGLPLPPPVGELVAIWRANHGRLDEETAIANARANDYSMRLV